MNKYLPRFKPEVYLRFLNSSHTVNGETLYPSISNQSVEDGVFTISLYVPPNDECSCYVSTQENQFMGFCIEECLDQAILATRFEESL